MKKLFLLPTILFSLNSFATVRTVSNSPATLAQFNTIQAAVDASASGDSVYVHGSPNEYVGFTITGKQLVIIGPGWEPDKDLPHTAYINTNIVLTDAGSSGTEIQGLTLVAGITIASAGINDIHIIRNHFINNSISISIPNSGIYSNYTIEGNWFTQSGIRVASNNTYENFLIQNNIFHMNVCCYGNSLTGEFTNVTSVVFNHNLFYGATGSTGFNPIFNSGGNNGLIFTNNIFVKRTVDVKNSSFTNNITFGSDINTPWAINGNVDAGGNLANQDPQMNDQVAINAGTDNPLLNYTIATGPANNSAADGKDMGLLFDAVGSLNWANSRNSRLPRISKINIINPTVQVGGVISVSVEAKTSN